MERLLNKRLSRRDLLRGALVGAAGLVVERLARRSAAQSGEKEKGKHCVTELSLWRDENCQPMGHECVKVCLEEDNKVSVTQVTMDQCIEELKWRSEQSAKK